MEIKAKGARPHPYPQSPRLIETIMAWNQAPVVLQGATKNPYAVRQVVGTNPSPAKNRPWLQSLGQNTLKIPPIQASIVPMRIVPKLYPTTLHQESRRGQGHSKRNSHPEITHKQTNHKRAYPRQLHHKSAKLSLHLRELQQSLASVFLR
ncbi:hypothetical protein BJX63DRAFT_390715 [Aspergillus granulosus]|uniref:Uncharacterized protein n=1 Tax=Aspergillus granulosus TaxID=176169 RepID=A0ABR4HI78_9EURO